MSAPAFDWTAANQRYLVAELARVRALLAGSTNGEPSAEAAAWPDPERPPALELLCRTFGLSPFERDILLLSAGYELDSRFPAACAGASDLRRPYPTFSLALAALPQAHWSAIAPAGALRYWRLVELGQGDSLTGSPLRIDERVLHYLAGVSHMDERLNGLIEPLTPEVEASSLPPSHLALAERIAGLWLAAGGADQPVLLLAGDEQAGPHAVAAAACELLDLRLYLLRPGDVPASPSEREALARLWEREALLDRAVLLVDWSGPGSENAEAGAIALLDRLRSMTIVVGRETLPLRRRPVVRLDVARPSAAEQQALWRLALGPLSAPLDGRVEALVAQFNLGLPGIRAASAEVRGYHSFAGEPSEADGAALGQVLWDACRAQARPRLDDLAQRIEPAATWDDLVLPEPQKQILRHIAAHVRQRARVYEAWGFGARSGRGLGISALFAGASGTGKTMAAEVLANELRLDLYRIDLSQVVSKYIGETEKNLRRVFDAAESGGAVLLFDEADALFGKRSEVKDSHDRYANIEVSYLLQRMEAYRGLAILTTNMKHALDPAFLRRLRFVVQFPFPDMAQRAEIWRRIFPPQTPTEGLEPTRLARLNVAGGNIHNIALQAAFLAADAGQPVRMVHVLQAARAEYAKLEKPLTEAEIGGWL